MSSAGCRGVLALLVLAASGCGAGSPRAVEPPGRAPRALATAAPPLLAPPSLSPAPPVEASMVLQLDFAALLSAITAGTEAHLLPSTIAELWPGSALDFARPVTMLRVAPQADAMIMRVALAPGARLELGAADDELAARGLKPLKGGYCAVQDGASSADSVLCGPRPALLAFGRGQVPKADLPPRALTTLDLDFARGAQVAQGDARAEVPRFVDPLFPRSMPPTSRMLRPLLTDLGFELLSRQNELWRKLGPLRLSASLGDREKVTVSATLAPEAGSIADKSLAGARPVHLPAAFWELSPRTDGALVFDASLLAELLAPSARSLALAAEGKLDGPFVEELSALPAACLAPGRSIVWAVGRDREGVPSSPSWPPELVMKPPPVAPDHTLIAVEDEQGRCSKAVTLMLDDYLRMRTVAGSDSNQRYLKVLPIPKPLPKSARLFSVGGGDDPTYFALATHRGALWLARSTDLTYLERTLTDLLSSAPARQGLKSRRELSALTTTGALASGFWREDEVSLGDLLGASQSRTVARSSARDERPARRVPFSVAREGQTLRVEVKVDVVAVRRVVARLLGEAIRGRELAPLPAEQREAALRVLDAACMLDDAASCNMAGVIYGEGRGAPKDAERAVKLLDRACQLQSGFGCANLTFYQKLAAADELKLFQKSCDLDTPFGCAWLGARMLDQDNADKRLAISKLQLGCDGYVGFACARIGSHYWNGEGLPKDEEKAADFFERACLLRNGFGCVELASALQLGKGRQHDEALALSMLKKSCTLDKAAGCFALGAAYLRGVGTAKDTNLARQHLGTACDANHAEACRWLAELSEEP